MINRRSALIALGALAVTVIMPRPVKAQQAAVHVPHSVLERYAGDYVYPDGTPFRVRVVGNTIVQEAPGRRLPYTPLSETLFLLGPAFTAEFVVEAGGLTQVLSDGAGVEYRLRRKGAPPVPPPPPAPAVSVPRHVLEQYVGVYEFIPGQMQRTDLRIVIRLKGDTLIRDIGQEAVLTPISNTRFKVGTTALIVEFVVDDWGVTQVLGTGFQQMLARLTSKR